MRRKGYWREFRFLDPLRGVARQGRTGLTRRLHTRRRERLRSRLRELAPVRRVLVLCLGNICRSPFGEARLAQVGGAGVDLEVRSAGLMGPGRPPPETAQSVAKNMGLDLSDHTSQLITPEIVTWTELFVVMDPGQAKTLESRFGVSRSRIAVLGDLDPLIPDRRGIPDPLDRSEAFFTETYERMDRCLAEFITLIRG